MGSICGYRRSDRNTPPRRFLQVIFETLVIFWRCLFLFLAVVCVKPEHVPPTAFQTKFGGPSLGSAVPSLAQDIENRRTSTQTPTRSSSAGRPLFLRPSSGERTELLQGIPFGFRAFNCPMSDSGLTSGKLGLRCSPPYSLAPMPGSARTIWRSLSLPLI